MIVDGDGRSGAMFSDDGTRRYRLWRVWDNTKPYALFTMLNPSKAAGYQNDPTVERQERRVRMWGQRGGLGLFVTEAEIQHEKEFGGIFVGNAFPVVSTDPQVMIRMGSAAAWGDADGEENRQHLLAMAQRVIDSKGVIVCGWGKHILEMGERIQDRLVLSLMGTGYPISALKLNGDGTPCHPLYLSYEMRPRRWDGIQLHEELV